LLDLAFFVDVIPSTMYITSIWNCWAKTSCYLA